ncbi:SAM-dependent methyltransferase [Streptacidiphilus albus]|uniref:SAM-dependent methyltransferase n=1 Tax=Streptacidiphilus albus TaxID=105425 RepID=UPI0005A84F77|nr:SAM-dependent methyltransferase [Streptacidiphilus albus]
MMNDPQQQPFPSVALRTDVAHPARVYDVYLGGKDNFPADREAAQKVSETFPTISTTARANRDFLLRAVKQLAGSGVRQFLDIGTGIPTSPAIHEVAQGIDPHARVVYVDNDPMVLVHARALLTSTTALGRTAYVDADLRHPETILNDPQLWEVLDPALPVALILGAILHFLPDDLQPQAIVKQLLAALPRQSYLVLSHVTADFDSQWNEIERLYNAEFDIPLQVRSADEVAHFFTGLELLPPGLTVVSQWQPEGLGRLPSDASVSCVGGVGRMP